METDRRTELGMRNGRKKKKGSIGGLKISRGAEDMDEE